MKLKIANLAVIMFCCSAQAGVQVQKSSGETVDTPGQSMQQSSVQELQQQAGQWGLSQDDYQRYKSLMSGPRGIQSPGLDPLSTLGIEARSEAERRKYAEKWVREEFARTQKELDFQREVSSAARAWLSTDGQPKTAVI